MRKNWHFGKTAKNEKNLTSHLPHTETPVLPYEAMPCDAGEPSLFASIHQTIIYRQAHKHKKDSSSILLSETSDVSGSRYKGQ